MSNNHMTVNGFGVNPFEERLHNPIHTYVPAWRINKIGPNWSCKKIRTNGPLKVISVKCRMKEKRQIEKIDQSIKRELKEEVDEFIDNFSDRRIRQMNFVSIKERISNLFEFVKNNDSSDAEILVILDLALQSMCSENLSEYQANSLRNAISILNREEHKESDVEKVVELFLESGIQLFPRVEGLWKHY